jgi:hypothetical protein
MSERCELSFLWWDAIDIKMMHNEKLIHLLHSLPAEFIDIFQPSVAI